MHPNLEKSHLLTSNNILKRVIKNNILRIVSPSNLKELGKRNTYRYSYPEEMAFTQNLLITELEVDSQ